MSFRRLRASNLNLAAATQEHAPLGTVVFDSAVYIVNGRVIGRPQTLFENEQSLTSWFAIAGILEIHLVRVRKLLIVIKEVLSTSCTDLRWMRRHTESPPRVVDIVNAVIPDTARAEAVTPMPTVYTVFTVWLHRRRTDPRVVVQLGRRLRRLSMSDVLAFLNVPGLADYHITDNPVAQHVDCFDAHRRAAHLRTVLHDTVIAPRRLD